MPNHSNLATGFRKSVWLCGSIASLSTKDALDALLLLSANRDAWWWLQRLLHLMLSALSSTCFSHVHVRLQQGRDLFYDRSRYGPILLLFLR